MNTGNISIKASVSGNTPGLKGEKGNGIKSTVLNDDYSLTFNYTNGTSDTTPPIRGQKGEKGDNGISPSITTSKSGKVTTITIKDATGTKVATINDGVDSQGDMLKSTYDKNSNGIVDNSEKVNGHTVESNVPANAKFTDTIYSHPINSGNKHIPTGGSSGQILKWEEDGTAKWDDSIEAHREGTELKVNNYKQLIKFTKEGKTEQKSYTGKNVIPLKQYNYTTKGVTVTTDIETGIITINGTCEEDNTAYVIYDDFILNGSYTFNLIYLSGTISNTTNTTRLHIADKDWGNQFYLPFVNSNNYTSRENISNVTYKNHYIRIDKGVTFNNYKVKAQLVQGTNSDYDFEPYVGGTQSPNPDYPQEIKNVRGVENLLKLPDGTYESNGITAVIKDGVITLNGTATVNDFLKIPIGNLKSGTYSMSANNDQTVGSINGSGQFASYRINTDNKTIKECFLGKKNSTAKFTILDDTNVDFIIRTNVGLTYNNFVIKPQLEEGQIAHNFVPNGSNYLQLKNTTDNKSKIINVDLKGNNLCSDKEQTLKDELVIENGRAKIIKKYDEVILTGSENWSINSSSESSKGYYEFSLTLINKPTLQVDLICNKFQTGLSYNNSKEQIRNRNDSELYINVLGTRLSSLNAIGFKTWLKSQYDSGNPVRVQYELAEPKVIDLGEIDFDLIENSTLTCEEESNMQIDYLTIDSNIFVQDSLDGNSSQKAPSINAVNEIISKLEARIIALENKNV